MQDISRRTLVFRLSSSGLLAWGGAASLSRAASASQPCGRQTRHDEIGQTVYPAPTGDGRSVVETDCMPNHVVGPYSAGAAPRPTEMQLYLPANPELEDAATPVGERIFGVAINGVPFESIGPTYPGADEWRFNVLSPAVRPYLGIDVNNGHVYASGQYHYVGTPLGLMCGLLDARQQSPGAPVPMMLIGWAADGFPIYAGLALGPLVDDGTPLAHTLFRSSYLLKSGRRPEGSPGGLHDGTFVQDFEFVQGAGDLDECNGRFGATPEYPAGTYYYVVTTHFPFLPLLFRGKPDSSFTTRSGPMSLPAELESYSAGAVDAGAAVPATPASDASVLGFPHGLASAQQPLVVDSAGYRYFLAIGSGDGRLYYSSIAVDSGAVITPWQRVPRQIEGVTLRPDLVVLADSRVQVTISSELSKLRVSADGSLESGTIQFEPWRPVP